MAAVFDTVLGLSLAGGFGATVEDGIDGPDCRKRNATTSNELRKRHVNKLLPQDY